MNDAVNSSPLIWPAQTNTALYCQLYEAGHLTADIARVQHAYRVSCKLFNGRYRKTERAFVCHAVGAASSVAHFDRRIEIIIAAMLHAAYDGGQFPDGRIGLSDDHRKWLAAEVGPEIDQLIANYLKLSFGKGMPEQHAKNGVPEEQADVLLIALAHEVDDMADCGLAFAPKYGRSIESRVAACAALAHQIGQPLLAETLEGHGKRYQDIAWIADLEAAKLQGYRVVPNLIAYYRLRRDHRRGKAVEVF